VKGIDEDPKLSLSTEGLAKTLCYIHDLSNAFMSDRLLGHDSS